MELSHIIQFALGEWETMRTQLERTILSYVSACTTLSQVCVQASEKTTVERALLAIDSGLEALANEEILLQNSRGSLLKLRNKSATLAPINALPSEILTRIFAMTNGPCTLPHDTSFAIPYPFSNVCTHWREIITGTPALWCHIDIGPDVPQSASNFMLERSQSSMIYVHACKKYIPEWNQPLDTIEYEAEQVIQIILPHLHRIYALDLVSSDKCSKTFVEPVLDFWLSYGNEEISRSLSISQNTLGNINITEPETHRPERWDPMLHSLNVVHLRGLAFGWESCAYSGLTKLELCFPKETCYVTTSTFANVLAASPAMTTLSLRHALEITPMKGWACSEPVRLDHLRIVRFYLSLRSLKLLLPLVSLPKHSKNLQVGVLVCDDIHDELSSFLGDSAITTLYCSYQDRSRNFRAWGCLLEQLPYLRNLVLHYFDLSDADQFDEINSVTSALNSFGAYRTQVIILSCIVTFEGINRFIVNTGVKDIRLETDYVLGASDQDRVCNIRTALVQAHPGLCCIISTDSTYTLECRSE